MNYRINKAIQIAKVEGTKELLFRLFRFIYRTIPAGNRLTLQKYIYRALGYKAIGNLLRVYSVPTEDIKYEIGKDDLRWRLLDFRIRSGDWDLKKSPVEQNEKYKMFYQHFKNDESWRETERYQTVIKKVKNNEKVNELDSPRQTISEYEEYLEYFDKLYKDISENGYKSQKDLKPNSDFVKRDIHPSLNEIQVFIGRNGEIICKSGLHRLYMAKIIGIEKVLVRTQVRHKEWQKLREDIVKKDNFDALSQEKIEKINHPDLGDITLRN